MDLDIKDSLEALGKLSTRIPEISIPEQLQLLREGKLKKHTADVLRRGDLKKAGIAACSVMAALTLISFAGQYRFHKRIVAGELKKQLAPIKRQLNELQEENAQLRADLAEKNAAAENHPAEDEAE